MSREILEKAWKKERSRMSKTSNILESWRNDELQLLNVESSLPRRKAIKQLERWSVGRLQELQQRALKKIPKVEVSEKRQKKVMKTIKWKADGKGLPKIKTIKFFETRSKRFLLKFEKSDLPRKLINGDLLREWSKRWLERLQGNVILQEERATQIVEKLATYRQKKTSKCTEETHIALEETENVKMDVKPKTMSECPSLEMTIAKPLEASVEFAKDAAGFLDTNHKELLAGFGEGKEILIEGWSAKLVLGLIYKTVNCKRFKSGGDFKFELCSSGNEEQKCLCIHLEANPTKHQPGNGRITLHVTGLEYLDTTCIDVPITCFLIHTYEQVADELESRKINGRTLAKSLRALFRSCADVMVYEDIIHYIYFLLLFEIGRRMVVETDQKSQRAKSYDSLPVAVTIAKIVDLFQHGILSPNDVFRDGRRYNIFKGEPGERRNAIWGIEAIYRQNQEKDQQSINCVKELENCFNPMHCFHSPNENA